MKRNPNRLAIFIGFDKDGIIDDYAFYILEQLKLIAGSIKIVYNGKVGEEYLAKLFDFSKEVTVRENVGYDISAIKEALLSVHSERSISGYDELVICNDSFYGPFIPFQRIFADMEEKNIDFWGLTSHFQISDPYGLRADGIFPDHISSYFTVIRNNLLKDNSFIEYWENLPEIESYEQAISYHEAEFTKFFSKLGYKWDVFVETWDKKLGDNENYDLHTFNLDELVTSRNCPIIKRKHYTYGNSVYLGRTFGGQITKATEHVRKMYDYDLRLIVQNLKRFLNPIELSEVFSDTTVLNVNALGKSSLVVVIILTSFNEFSFAEKFITFCTKNRISFTFAVREEIFHKIKDYNTTFTNLREEDLPLLKNIVIVLDFSCIRRIEKPFMGAFIEYLFRNFEVAVSNEFFLNETLLIKSAIKILFHKLPFHKNISYLREFYFSSNEIGENRDFRFSNTGLIIFNPENINLIDQKLILKFGYNEEKKKFYSEDSNYFDTILYILKKSDSTFGHFISSENIGIHVRNLEDYIRSLKDWKGHNSSIIGIRKSDKIKIQIQKILPDILFRLVRFLYRSLK